MALASDVSVLSLGFRVSVLGRAGRGFLLSGFVVKTCIMQVLAAAAEEVAK